MPSPSRAGSAPTSPTPAPALPPAGLWLAMEDHVRDHAARWWNSTGCALLPTGNAFDYVKSPQCCARAVADRFPKAALIHYPRYGGVAVLVAPGTAATWDPETAGGMVCEGAGEHLNVPAPDRTSMEGGNPYWLRPPDDQPWFPPANELAPLLHQLEEAAMRTQQIANEHEHRT